ncbi:MAG: hypothetical protein C0404_03980 [Verrucomicrobia bacterium]|nr:hypothetical protein [Verrucomicrobiota bacterium]
MTNEDTLTSREGSAVGSAGVGPDDVELLRRYARQGDTDALALLFQRHSDSAYRTALRFTGNTAEAEDAVQTTFINIMRIAGNYRGGQGVRVWITKIVLSVCKTKIRENVRRRSREERSEGDPALHAGPDDDSAIELGERVKKALGTLPEKYRIPIWLHHYEGMPFEEVALATEIPQSTLRCHVSRGLELLRSRLAQTGTALSLSSIASALTSAQAELLPSGVGEQIVQLLRNGPPGPADVPDLIDAARSSASGVAWKVIAVIFMCLTVGSIVMFNRTPDKLPAQPPVAAPPLDSAVPAQDEGARLDYYWNFDSPAVPAEFLVLTGKWHRVASSGIGGSGCMQSDSDLLILLINVPADSLPLLVSYKAKPLLAPGQQKGSFQSKVDWAEQEWTAAMTGISANYSGLTWITRREYLTKDFIYRWHDLGECEFRMLSRTPGSRLVLVFEGLHLIDDLRIERIREADVPDADRLIQAIADIPQSKRRGLVPLPQIKPGRPDVKTVFVQFYGRSSILEALGASRTAYR